jgi:UrcA family protein
MPLLKSQHKEINAMTAVIEKSITAALIAALLIAPGHPMAADAMQLAPRSVATNSGTAVRFADLDVSKPEDVARLYARISRTARDICGRSNADGDGRMSLEERCIAKTIEDAVSRINRPMLTALYAEHLKRALGS